MILKDHMKITGNVLDHHRVYHRLYLDRARKRDGEGTCTMHDTHDTLGRELKESRKHTFAGLRRVLVEEHNKRQVEYHRI